MGGDEAGSSSAGTTLTPVKPRAKKEKAVGSGTNKSASKVKKNTTPRKGKKAIKGEDEDSTEAMELDSGGE